MAYRVACTRLKTKTKKGTVKLSQTYRKDSAGGTESHLKDNELDMRARLPLFSFLFDVHSHAGNSPGKQLPSRARASLPLSFLASIRKERSSNWSQPPTKRDMGGIINLTSLIIFSPHLQGFEIMETIRLPRVSWKGFY